MLNKDTQNALLFTLYISRGGRVPLYSVSEALGLTQTYIKKTLVPTLAKANIIQAIPGYKGGYELLGDPIISKIIRAMGNPKFLTDKESNRYRRGEPEHRALWLLGSALNLKMNQYTKLTINTLMNQLVNAELYVMDKKRNAEMDQ